MATRMNTCKGFSVELGRKWAFDQCWPVFWCCTIACFIILTLALCQKHLLAQQTFWRMGRMKSGSSIVLKEVLWTLVIDQSDIHYLLQRNVLSNRQRNFNLLIVIIWTSQFNSKIRSWLFQNFAKWLSLGSLWLCWNIEILVRSKVNKIVWHVTLYDGWQPIVQYCFIPSNILFLWKGQD